MARTGVDKYYDANTGRFLAVGGSGAALAIHRQLWADGITTPSAAAAHINDIIRDRAEHHLGTIPQQVCDLGCGVGGSVFHLAQLWPDTGFTGITISGAQKDRAMAEAAARSLHARCRFIQADFTAPPDPAQPAADLAIAIESHVHAESAAEFLTAAARFLRKGGILIVVDDMLAQPEPNLPPAQRHWLDAFRKGWRLGHVPDKVSILRHATQAGFTTLETQDLTPLLRLNRRRDRLLHVIAPAVDWLGLNRWPIFGNMIGGDGLTRLYRMGAMRYACVILQLNA